VAFLLDDQDYSQRNNSDKDDYGPISFVNSIAEENSYCERFQE